MSTIMKKIFSKILFLFLKTASDSLTLCIRTFRNYIKRGYIVDGSRGTRVFRSRLSEYPVNRALAKVRTSGDSLSRQ